MLVAVSQLATTDDQPALAGRQAPQAVQVALPCLVVDKLPVMRRRIVRVPDRRVRRDAVPTTGWPPQLVTDSVLDRSAKVGSQGAGLSRLEAAEPRQRLLQRVLLTLLVPLKQPAQRDVLEPSVRSLPTLRAALDGAAERAGWDEVAVNRLQLAGEEAFLYLLERQEESKPRPVRVAVRPVDDVLQIEIVARPDDVNLEDRLGTLDEGSPDRRGRWPAHPPPRGESLGYDAFWLDDATAAEARAEVGEAIPVTVAPTPELDALALVGLLLRGRGEEHRRRLPRGIRGRLRQSRRDRARRCTAEERRWLEAQRAAWLSVWEVEAVDAGKTVTLHDLLSDERRTVHETRGSRTLVTHDAVLARIVDHDGVPLLCGVHPRPLPPVEAAEVVRRARARLRRKRSVPVDRLRGAAFGRNLIRYWEEAVEDVDVRRRIPPDLRNRDGDALLLTVDHFEVAAGAMAAIEARVAELDGAHREPAAEDTSAYVFLRPVDPAEPDGEQALLGRLRIGPDVLRIETNSEARADALRARVEEVCGSRLRHRAREHMDPLALADRPGWAAATPAAALARTGAPAGRVQEAPLRRLGGPAAAGAEREDAT